MLVHAHSIAVRRGVAEPVAVELDLRAGLPSFSVIGLAGAAARDARERVQAAVLNSGHAFPRRRVTVNLAPASNRRVGSEFDLAIACCVLAAQGHIEPGRLWHVALYAELGLGGDLRPCAGAGAAAAAAADADLRALIVARADLCEARATGALPVAGRRDLRGVVALLARAGAAPAGAVARAGPRRRGHARRESEGGAEAAPSELLPRRGAPDAPAGPARPDAREATS